MTHTNNKQIIYGTGDNMIFLNEGDFVRYTYGGEKSWGRIRDNDGVPFIRSMDRILLNKWRGIELHDDVFPVKDLEVFHPEIEIVEFFNWLEKFHYHTNITLEQRHSDKDCRDCKEGF